MIRLREIPLAGVSLALCMVATGCSSEQRAIDAAKKDVLATKQSEEVVYVDRSGNTTLTMVSAAPGASAPVTSQTVVPAGTAATAGLPDWSNGLRPAPQHAARFRAPGMMVADTALPAPGTVTNTAAYGTPANAAMTGTAPVASTPYAPAFVASDVTLPAGTGLAIRINQRIDVKHAQPGQRFTGELAESVTRDGNVLLPRGTDVRGVVDAAHRRGHFKGRSILSLRLTSLTYGGRTYPLETANFVASKKGKGKRTAGFIGGTAGVGMLVGGVASGGVGLLAGGLAGGGLGTLLAGATGNRDIVIPAESTVRFRLADDLTVQHNAGAVASNSNPAVQQDGY
jgi:hypothetical protein